MKAWADPGRNTIRRLLVTELILSKGLMNQWSKALLMTIEEPDTFKDQLTSLVNEKDCFRVKLNFDCKLTLNLQGNDA